MHKPTRVMLQLLFMAVAAIAGASGGTDTVTRDPDRNEAKEQSGLPGESAVMDDSSSIGAATVTNVTTAVEIPEGRSAVIVELFTSEGCSSCPAGEEALGRIRMWADSRGLPVYTVAWHVDYWDSLGWPDPYGSSDASDRQRWYAKGLNSSRYTPQVIVNGRTIAGYAGDSREIERIVLPELERPAAGGPENYLAEQSGAGRLNITFESAGNFDVEAVVVEENLVSRPEAGENRNRELHHVSTVRSHGSGRRGTGAIELDLPADVNLSNASIVVMVRPAGRPEIIDARRLPVPSAPTGTLSGRLSHPDGRAAIGRILQICTDTLCIPVTSDSGGAFSLPGLSPGTYTLKSATGDPGVDFVIISGNTTEIDLVVPAAG